MNQTEAQFNGCIQECREIFKKKLQDYGAAWRIMRPTSLTDQIYIKANRIRTLETKENLVGEGIRSELIGIINYCIIALIQLELGYSETDDINVDTAISMYDKYVENTKKLLAKKNHDYDEAWRQMRNESYTDLILMKIHRKKQIENNGGKTIISEGIDANYYDMLNYAVFYMIQQQIHCADEKQ